MDFVAQSIQNLIGPFFGSSRSKKNKKRKRNEEKRHAASSPSAAESTDDPVQRKRSRRYISAPRSSGKLVARRSNEKNCQERPLDTCLPKIKEGPLKPILSSPESTKKDSGSKQKTREDDCDSTTHSGSKRVASSHNRRFGLVLLVQKTVV